jgi:predicted permease
LLVESMTLGVFGGALGLGLAYAGLRLLVAMGPANLPRLNEISIDPIVLAFAVGISLLSGLLFGLIPVLKYASPGVAPTLSAGGRALSQSRERYRTQSMLVTMQVALAMVLLVGSGLMIRSFQALKNVQPGFDRPEQIQTLRISIPQAQAEDPERVVRMQHEILQRVTAIPGVTSAAFINALPMETEFQGNTTIFIEDKPISEGQIAPVRRIKYVSPGLFQTLRTPLIVGRDFTWTEIYSDRDVAVVSENLARETWGTPSAALGKRIRGGGTVNPWCEIIGVVGDVYDNGAQQQAATIVYWPARLKFGGTPDRIRRSVSLAIRSDRTGTESFLNQIREAVWAVNANLPLAQVRTLGEIYRQSTARTSFTLTMLAIAGGMALLLGIIGIYGVISYAVSQRNREIGIRLALGAQQGKLKRMFVQHALVLATIGAAIGLVAAAELTQLMSSLLFGISPFDPATYLAGVLILAMAAVLASYLPARRAAVVDPVDALKAE